jgi:hypothetical protein
LVGSTDDTVSRYTLFSITLLPCSTQGKAFLNSFQNVRFLLWEVVSFSSNTRAGGPLLVGFPQLFIQYIRSCPAYLDAVCSNCNQWTGHVGVTGIRWSWNVFHNRRQLQRNNIHLLTYPGKVPHIFPRF